MIKSSPSFSEADLTQPLAEQHFFLQTKMFPAPHVHKQTCQEPETRSWKGHQNETSRNGTSNRRYDKNYIRWRDNRRQPQISYQKERWNIPIESKILGDLYLQNVLFQWHII